MEPIDFIDLMERLHTAANCDECPPALKRRCDDLRDYPDLDDLCTLITYIKHDVDLKDKHQKS